MSRIERREFVFASAAALSSLALGNQRPTPETNLITEAAVPPAFSITPVVGDGKWIWREPPNETGYLEQREFEVSIGMEFTGTGPGTELNGTTVAPVEFPEQKILGLKIEPENCQAKIIQLSDSASQLALYVDSLATNQNAAVTAIYRLQICKSYMGFTKDQFPAEQPRLHQAPKIFLKSSPGIKTATTLVKQLASSIAPAETHPWDRALKIYQWVWENIEGVPGKYTSVDQAIKNRKGDCEERACTFIALCRASGIPARQVWIPGHVWAEIALHDHDGRWHWIPVHTAAYNWFGWTGAHEVILQKGDRVNVPIRNRRLRLVDDWFQIKGPRPRTKFTASIQPIAAEGGDPGPGARRKLASGEWKLTGNHSANRFSRNH